MGRAGVNVTGNEKEEWVVPLERFSTLKNGGFQNDLLVEALIYTGEIWKATNKKALLVNFKQNI